MANPGFGCGNPECGASSGSSEESTFGSGELNDYGYWEHPCDACARAFEKAHPEYAPCWPPKDEAKIALVKEAINADYPIVSAKIAFHKHFGYIPTMKELSALKII